MTKLVILAVGFLLLFSSSLSGYHLPEVFFDDDLADQLNRQSEYVGEALNELKTRADSVDTVTSYREAIDDSLQANWPTWIADDTSLIFDAIHDTVYGNPDVMVNHDTLFCGYNTTTKTILADQTMFLELDGTTRSDDIYTVVQSDTVLDISTAGDYLVTYGASVDYDAGSGASYFRVQLMKYTSSWAAVTGSVLYQAIEANAAGHYMTVSKSIIVTLTAGNDLGVEFYVPVTLPTVEIIANTGFLTIEKMH